MAKFPGLMRRGSKWYLRVKVPDDVVDAIGKREIWKSLRTGDHQLARTRYFEERTALERRLLVVYDARNPAFGAGGRANQQWEAAVAGCLAPGLMRRLSCQRLLRVLAADPDFDWLVSALVEKYGFAPI